MLALAALTVAASTAYVRFAARDAALLDLMFTTKNTVQSPTLQAATERVFTTVGDLIAQGQQDRALLPGDPERLRLS